MKTKTKFITMLLLGAILIQSCKKGDTGAPGKDGTNGTNGNANVYSTNTVSTTSSSWTLNSPLYSTTFLASGITQSIVDNGAVMVFSQTGTSWDGMPYTLANTSYSYGFGVGFVNIYVTTTDGSTPVNPGNQTYRIEIIEGH